MSFEFRAIAIAWLRPLVVVTGLVVSTSSLAIDADTAIRRFGQAVASKDAAGEREMLALPGFATLVDSKGATPLFAVARAGRVDLAEWLLAQKVDVNRRDARGRSALFFAVVGSRAEMVDWLIRKGASVQGERDASPLGAAVLAGDATVTRALLDAGARLFTRLPDYPSSDVLDAAVGAGRVDMLRLLLDTTEARAMPEAEVTRLKHVARQLTDSGALAILEEFERARAPMLTN